MVQDTRKDPRAKVLTMTVRYKSATVDEFIEHHSHDVSRGGIYIKTPSPFPPGTLLKFEIRILEDRPVINGVGRVVWKRDASQATNERPAGMGVKFLKIDENSRQIIDRIVAAKGDVPSAFESEGVETPLQPAVAPTPTPGPAVAPGAAPAPTPAPAKTPSSVPPRPTPSRKATMLGLGAVELPATGEPAEAIAVQKVDRAREERPMPEEATVMRQAAELLADALKGAGGSLEEVGAAELGRAAEAASAAIAPRKREPETATAVQIPKEEPKIEKPAEPAEKREKADVVEPSPAEPAKEAKPAPEPEAPKRPVAAARRREPEPVAALETAAEQKPSGGGARILLLLAVGAAAAVGIWYFGKPSPPAEPSNPTVTTPVQATATTPPKPTEIAVPEATRAPEAMAPSSTALLSAAPDASAATSVSATAKAEKPPTKPPPETTGALPTKPPETPTTPPAKPAAPKPETTEAPPPKPPPPKPPPKPASDNPY